jgi:hypothetical protein
MQLNKGYTYWKCDVREEHSLRIKYKAITVTAMNLGVT